MRRYSILSSRVSNSPQESVHVAPYVPFLRWMDALTLLSNIKKYLLSISGYSSAYLRDPFSDASTVISELP